MAPEGQVGQKEMYIKIQKVYEPVLLRWAMWPMGLLLNGKRYGFHILYACPLWQGLSIGIVILDIITLGFYNYGHLWNLPHMGGICVS
jgi:hypothetical protein